MGHTPLRQELAITRRALRGPSAPRAVYGLGFRVWGLGFRAEFGVFGALFLSRFWELELVCV